MIRGAGVAVLLGIAAGAAAADFRSVAEAAAVLYDAPSARSNRLYVVSKGYPLEVVVSVEGWAKVRDANGDLSWIRSKVLTDQRTLMVKAPVAQIRQAAEDSAPLVFQAQQGVLLELIEVRGAWLRVRHGDGTAGFVRSDQIWGV